MSRIIKMPTPKRIIDRRLSAFFAEQELKDFKELLELLLQQCDNYVVLEGVKEEIHKYYLDAVNEVHDKHYPEGELCQETVQSLIETYGRRFDVYEFYDQYLKTEN